MWEIHDSMHKGYQKLETFQGILTDFFPQPNAD